ncbi:ATP-binding protein [Spirosoma spitsbergense]|uniref:ATP-binding protein n=1 Tax=Spirosoma spitsbergense TaxID=431554 RepID=UPI0003774827|nr:ATP-binding protein [Spirosoma spitsbergense]
MVNFSFFNWFKNKSIAKKLYSVVGIMAVLIAVELGTLYFAVSTLSSVRAFVGAEGLWSKSQKDAIYHLRKYYQTHNEEDRTAFYTFMKVPLGDHKTLLELVKQNPDLAIARQGLLEGGNHPDDIDGMINLFRRFNKISYIHKSIKIWTEADSGIGQLIPIAKKIHSEINLPIGQLAPPALSQTKLDELVKNIDPINQKLTILENEFSYTLGEGARWLEKIILKLLLAIALTVEFSGLLLTYFVVKGITKGLNEITSASKRIAQKDYSVKAQVFSADEIGILATSFNDMTVELFNNIQKRVQADQELEFKTNFIQENEKRIVSIMDALIKITQLDFSEKLIVSERGDELDAIAVGLNTMSEELEFHLQQVEQSEAKLNDAQRLAKIGSWEMDMTTHKVHWSNEMFNVYGYGNERFEVSFEKALERMVPEDVERTKARMEKNTEDALQVFKEKSIFEFEIAPSNFTIILPDDSKKVVQGIGKIILNTNGQITKIVGTVQDINEAYKAEQKLNAYNIELERKNKEIEQFAYAASHDLQEPLRSISNFSKLLADKLETYPDKEMNEYMRLISGGASRMSNLIFALLDYSRVGKDMDKREVDCNKLVHEILTDLAVVIAESGAKIHIEKLPVINCYDLKSVFQNLIINAIKFRKKDLSPVINISATSTGKDFLFIIKDNGIGIEKDYYDRIFIIFQRLHLRTQYAGTGIGLSLTKKIIEMHGGRIWVESEFGEGSTFYFTIPIS